MKLGLLADIHGNVSNLAMAIQRLRQERVDRFVVLGDIIYDTRNADQTVDLLRSCDAIGVWGNHELGLCVEPDPEIRESYSPSVMDFFKTLQPKLEIHDVLLSHTFPTEDAKEVLSYYVGEPTDQELIDRCFERLPHRLMISGHFHRWFASTPSGRCNWTGEQTLVLDPEQRYFCVVAAVKDSFAAILDLGQNALTPIALESDT